MNRAVIARELTKLPASAASKQAFREAFEQISIETVRAARVECADDAGGKRRPVLRRRA